MNDLGGVLRAPSDGSRWTLIWHRDDEDIGPFSAVRDEWDRPVRSHHVQLPRLWAYDLVVWNRETDPGGQEDGLQTVGPGHTPLDPRRAVLGDLPEEGQAC